MYSRKTGTLYNETQVKEKTDSFNNELRAQYRNHHTSERTEEKPVERNVPEIGINETIVIIGLIMLLLGEENKDYLLIGVLAILLFLNK